MAWIESHQELGQHWKLLRLASELRVHKAQALGHLQYLWWWALDYARKGDLSAFTSAEISAAAEWPGESDKFHESLKKVGWLDPEGTIHDWKEYSGAWLGGLARQKRYRRKTQRLHNANVTLMSNLTKPNQTKPKDNTPLPPLTPDQQRVKDFLATPPLDSLVDPDLFVRRVTVAYSPSVVLAALRDMMGYCAKKPAWEKSRKSWSKTIVNWLKRNSEQGRHRDGVQALAHGLKAMP